MKIISETTKFHIEEKTAVAIGKFDGIHRGHKKLLDKLMAAKKLGLRAAIFTFDPSPAVFFGQGDVRQLMTKEEKRARFEEMQIDYLVEYPFRKQTAAISPEDYVNLFLIKRMNAAYIVAGEDVSFGDKGLGDAQLLQQLAKESGVQVCILPKLCHNGREISSTYVREAVQTGNMELAAKLMEQPYYISGRVQKGNQIGRKLGMPTVNIYPDDGKIMPPNGVYFSTVTYGHQTFYGVTNVGYKPTVEDKKRMGVETYIYDFNEDIYEKDITVYLHHFERPEMKFENLDALKEAISKNVSDGKAYFSLGK